MNKEWTAEIKINVNQNKGIARMEDTHLSNVEILMAASVIVQTAIDNGITVEEIIDCLNEANNND